MSRVHHPLGKDVYGHEFQLVRDDQLRDAKPLWWLIVMDWNDGTCERVGLPGITPEIVAEMHRIMQEEKS